MCSFDATLSLENCHILEIKLKSFYFLLGLSLIIHFFTPQVKSTVFVQAFLVVIASACLLLANCFSYSLTMLSLFSVLLAVSCLACLICWIDSLCFKKLDNFLKIFQLWEETNLLPKVEGISLWNRVKIEAYTASRLKKEIPRKFSLFLTCTNLFYWSLLFNQNAGLVDNYAEPVNISMVSYGLACFLAVIIWLFLAYNFLKYALGHSLFFKKEAPIIPLLPFVVFNLYLSPLCSVFVASWFALEKANFWHKIFKSVFIPFWNLKLSPSFSLQKEGQNFIFIFSPSESNSTGPIVDFFPVVTWGLGLLGSWAKKKQFSNEVEKTVHDLGAAARPARKVLAVIDSNEKLAKTLSSGLENLLEARSPLKTDEEKVLSAQGAFKDFTRGVFAIQEECGSCSCEFSPRSGFPHPKNFPACFNSYHIFKESMKAANFDEKSQQSSASSVFEAFFEKVFL